MIIGMEGCYPRKEHAVEIRTAAFLVGDLSNRVAHVVGRQVAPDARPVSMAHMAKLERENRRPVWMREVWRANELVTK